MNASIPSNNSNTPAPVNGPLSKAAISKTIADAQKKFKEITEEALPEAFVNAMKYSMPGSNAASEIAKLQSQQARDIGEQKGFDTQRQGIQGMFAAATPLTKLFEQGLKGAGDAAKKSAEKDSKDLENRQKAEEPPKLFASNNSPFGSSDSGGWGLV